MAIFVLGYPGWLGGADTELRHTLRLWRQFELPVTVIPTWRPDPLQQHLLQGLGIPTVCVAGGDALPSVPSLAGGVVVSFCNGEFLKVAGKLRQLGCRLVWVNCMTWAFPTEIAHCEEYGPFDAYVFQSQFQQRELSPRYERLGAREQQFHSIRGAFAPEEFPYSPTQRTANEPFVVGRIARPDTDKWSANTWPIYGSIRYAQKRARVMAWHERLTAKCGAPPSWAEALPANAESAAKLLSSLHCLLPINGGARENWPRAGLEAMSAGVPIVTQQAWGWCEMIEHGETGFLAADDFELAHYAALLAYDEELRQHLAANARSRLCETLAHPPTLWQGWRRLFESLGELVPVQEQAA